MFLLSNKTRLTFNDQIQNLIRLGLWSSDISVPDPQTMERIKRLEEEISKRKYELHLPDKEDQSPIELLEKEYLAKLKDLKKSRKEKLPAIRSKIITKPDGIFHLGYGVSSWLNQQDTDIEKLQKYNLPILDNYNTFCNHFNITRSKLSWLTFHNKTSTYLHYFDFEFVKKSGGLRKISAPKKYLKSIQQSIKEDVLDKIPLLECVTGFRKKVNIYDNASVHKKNKIIVNADIQDFFPSINYYQVRSAFKNLGYSGEISTYFALLTTKQEAKQIQLKNKTIFSLSSDRYLPQGAPTSPVLANIMFNKIDIQLLKRSKSIGFMYTRYADDLTFSTSDGKAKIKPLLYILKKTLDLHGFKLNAKKTKIKGKQHSQEITGLIMNSGQPKVPRIWRRNLRAAIHNLKSIEDYQIKEDELLRINGCIQHLRLSHPHHALKYQELLRKIKFNL